VLIYHRSVFLSPFHFILTSHYQKFYEYTVELLFPVQITGPKGVGKSTSLFALAMKLKLTVTDDTNHTVLYFTERSLLSAFSHTTNVYLQDNGLAFTVNTIAKCLIYSNNKKFVVRAHIMRCNDPEGKKLLTLCWVGIIILD